MVICNTDIDCINFTGRLCYGNLSWNEEPFTCLCDSWFGWHGDDCSKNSFSTYIFFVFNSLNILVSLLGLGFTSYISYKLWRLIHESNQASLALFMTSLFALLSFVPLILWNAGVVANTAYHDATYLGPDGSLHPPFQPLIIWSVLLTALLTGLGLLNVSFVWIQLGKMLTSDSIFSVTTVKVVIICMEFLFTSVAVAALVLNGVGAAFHSVAQVYILFCICINIIGSVLVRRQLSKLLKTLFSDKGKQQEREIIRKSINAIRVTSYWNAAMLFLSLSLNVATTIMVLQNWKEFAPVDPNVVKPVALTNLGIEVVSPYVTWGLAWYCYQMLRIIRSKQEAREDEKKVEKLFSFGGTSSSQVVLS